MSQMKNYSKMYAPEEPETVVEPPIVQSVDDPEPTVVTGHVANCTKLNVREQMSTDSAVLCVLPAHSEVTVIFEEVYDEWYRVISEAGIKGFCMKQYIQL